MHRYETLEQLGNGSFGEVVRARSLKTNEIVAIKKMKALFPTWEECLQLRELKSLRVLRHENIVQLKEVVQDKEELYFVFEYMQSSLCKVMRQIKHQGSSMAPSSVTSSDDAPSTTGAAGLGPSSWFSEAQIRSIMYQLFCGLAHMHKHGFFHRDIKPENLLCHDETLKIADLGQAREIRSRPPYTDYVSTRWYRSPELLLRATTYNSPIDLWACGCIMAELFLQAPLFPGSSEADQMCRICKVLGTPTKENWPDGMSMVSQMQFKFPKCASVPWSHLLPGNTSKAALHLIQELIQYDPSRRLTAAQALQHQFFDQPVCRPMLTAAPTEATRSAAHGTTNSSSVVHAMPLMAALPLKAEFKSSFASYGVGPGAGGKKSGDDSFSETSGRWTRKDLASSGDSLGSSRKNTSPPAYDTSSSSWQSSKQTTMNKLFVHSPRETEYAADAKPTSRSTATNGNGTGVPASHRSRKALVGGEGYYSARKFSPSPEETDESEQLHGGGGSGAGRNDDEDDDATSSGRRDDEEEDSLQYQRGHRGSGPRPMRKRSEDHLLQDLLDEFIA